MLNSYINYYFIMLNNFNNNDDFGELQEKKGNSPVEKLLENCVRNYYRKYSIY